MSDDVAGRLQASAAAAFGGTPVRFAYLFGSHARGDSRPRSDVDVAVSVGDHDADRTSLVLDFQRRLYRHTGVECDLVILEDATLRLLHRILRDGVLIYDGDPAARIEFVATTRPRAADYAIHADRLDRASLHATGQGQR